MTTTLDRLLARATTNRRLKLTIYGSDRCNQRCFYCYQDHRGRHLTDDTRDGLVNLITARAPGLDMLDMAWFGGEPLLAGANLLAVQEAAHGLSQRHGFRLAASMTTNATLLEPYFDTLSGIGLNEYQITLEGPREMHDATRIDARGTPTFDTIWAMLTRMRDSDHDFATTIRLHYRPDDWMCLAPLVMRIDEIFLGDERFRLLFYPLQRWGGENEDAVTVVSRDAYVAIEEVLHGWTGKGNRPRVTSPNLGTHLAGCSICYAAEANAFTISPTGGIGKCTIVQGGRNAIGQLNADGTMSIDHTAHTPWLRGLVTREAGALACPAHAA